MADRGRGQRETEGPAGLQRTLDCPQSSKKPWRVLNYEVRCSGLHVESFLWLLCAEHAVGAGVRTKPAESWEEDQARRLEGKRLWMLRSNRLERDDGSEISLN